MRVLPGVAHPGPIRFGGRGDFGLLFVSPEHNLCSLHHTHYPGMTFDPSGFMTYGL